MQEKLDRERNEMMKQHDMFLTNSLQNFVTLQSESHPGTLAPLCQPSSPNDCRGSPIRQQVTEPLLTPQRTIRHIHPLKTTEILNLDTRHPSPFTTPLRYEPPKFNPIVRNRTIMYNQ